MRLAKYNRHGRKLYASRKTPILPLLVDLLRRHARSADAEMIGPL
jgi:hypothetical protein